MKKARVIAYYLPQFHPIKENDLWWGKGFTEWTNVGKAKPLFRNHYQPHVPADLGYYDLRMPEIRDEQAKLAKAAGIEGFCYWHYWFGNGKRLLERPFNEVLESGKPDFPFCLGWANESWQAKIWNADGKNDKTLIEQTYPGESDNEEHFYTLLEAFKDKRYIMVDGKPVFLIYRPFKFVKLSAFIEQWNKLAVDNGLNGIYFVGQASSYSESNSLLEMGCNSITVSPTAKIDYTYKSKPSVIRGVLKQIRMIREIPLIIKYSKAYPYFIDTIEDAKVTVIPSLIPNWDHSPRSGKKASVLHNSTPELFRKHLKHALSVIANKPQDHKILFLKSWNEWAEGNHVEPDLRNGMGYLDVLKEELS